MYYTKTKKKKENNMVGLLVSVFDNQVYEVDLDDKEPLEIAYQVMDCSTVDVVRNVRIGTHIYDILVDDEGLYRDNPKPSAKCSNAKQVLYGNIIVLNADDNEGNWSSLTKKDIDNIQENIFVLRHNETNEETPILEYSYNIEDDFEVSGVA